MHPKNAFVTLTYSEENLKSPKLVYDDFQRFMKRLRKIQNDPIGVFVTGEYGEKTKRPHWHAILFNYRPRDEKKFRRTDRGDQVYTSDFLSRIWGNGNAEYGEVTFESAGYCARYAAKKLVHGKDDEHDYKPISKKSSKHAIGKKWLEEFWPDVFSYGRVVLRDGSECAIPRYYEKWLKANHPESWWHYVTQIKFRNIKTAEAKARAVAEEEKQINEIRREKLGYKFSPQRTELEAKKIIQQQKFMEQLQKNLKL